MRVLFVLLMVIPRQLQNPLTRVVNASHPGGGTFQVGDRFELLVIGATDSTGRWSTSGQFEKSDFGGWSELWTVGARLANPAVQFSVNALCLPGGQGTFAISGLNMAQFCETAEGRQSFSTSSGPGRFRVTDATLVRRISTRWKSFRR